MGFSKDLWEVHLTQFDAPEETAGKKGFRILLPVLERLDDTGTEPHGTAPSHLVRLGREAISRDDLPSDKAARWLGYAYGVLSSRGVALPSETYLADSDEAVPSVVVGACKEALHGLLPRIASMVRECEEGEVMELLLFESFAQSAMAGKASPAGVNWILGYVQGVMTARGAMNMDDERDRTRPIFHEAYRKAGLGVPPTVAVAER